jgi:hypothetical protein
MGKISRRRNNNSVAAAAVSILLISSSGPLSPPLLIQGVHALGSAFSCGSSIREARSCTTLCSTSTADEGGSSSNKNSNNGVGGTSCPFGQKCYAGIECEPSKSMDWILDWQERIEMRIVGDSSSRSRSNISSLSTKIRTQQEKKEHSFVCGNTYADVEARCKRATATTTATASSAVSSADYHGVHHCPTGSSSECPASLECYYTTVPCSLQSQQQQQHELVVEYHGADLELPGLPPLVSPSFNILSRLDIDSLTMALSNDTNIITSSNTNMTEEVNKDEHVQEHEKLGSYSYSSSSSSSSWVTFFTESLSGMLMRMSMLSSLSSPSSISSASSSPHSLLRYSSRHDWN